MSTLRCNNITDTSGGSSSLSVPGAAKAWVNFNGTGTVAIRAQLNVSSITDNGVGDYAVNFSTALTDANYSAVATTSDDNAAAAYGFINGIQGGANTPTSSVLRVRLLTSTLVDRTIVNVSVFR